MPTVDLSMNGNGMGDLSIVGSPTPRAESRGAVTARNQSAKRITLNKSMNNGAAVTQSQLTKTKELVKSANSLHTLGKPKSDGVIPAGVPPLKLGMLYTDPKPNYNVVGQADTSRSVLSWGDNPSRPPSGVEKIRTVAPKSKAQRAHEERFVTQEQRPALPAQAKHQPQPQPQPQQNEQQQRWERQHEQRIEQERSQHEQKLAQIQAQQRKQAQDQQKQQSQQQQQQQQQQHQQQHHHQQHQQQHYEQEVQSEQSYAEDNWTPSPCPMETERSGVDDFNLHQEEGFEAFETEEERLVRKRQLAAVEETLLQDLSMPQTSADAPSSYSLRTPWASTATDSERADFYALGEVPRVKKMERNLHATSAELTYTRLKERGVESRLKFNVRFISRNGRDSLRDLYGFLFTVDNSIAIYEYKQIGKKRFTASPVFPRAVYRHPVGQFLGNPYLLRDIQVGATLLLPTQDNPVLPESITRSPLVPLRVTSVSEDDKISLVHDGCRPEERAGREEALRRESSKDSLEQLARVRDIQLYIQQQLRTRPVRALVGLGHYFTQHDTDKDGLWRADELQAALRTFRIQLYHEDFLALWTHLDQDGSGFLDVGEFMRGLLGEISEARMGLVHRAWCRMDPQKTGDVTYTTVRQFFNPVMPLDSDADAIEKMSKDDIMDEFLHCFSNGPLDKRITYSEFIDYYTALSITEEDDQTFAQFIKCCWNV